MSSKTQLWDKLAQLGSTRHSIQQLFSQEPNRADQFILTLNDLSLDFSKTHISASTLDSLVSLAQSCMLEDGINALFRGAELNTTEYRAALHTALRLPTEKLRTHEFGAQIQNTFDRMRSLVTALHEKQWRGYTGEPITDVVNIGVGGSDLGPYLATDALQAHHHADITIHFVSNMDAADIQQRLKHLKPESTLFIVASKSFSTLETLTNARIARAWVLASDKQADLAKHFIAVSANVEKAVEFGIDKESVYPLWDWVGGRYSLWSAIGLPIAMAIGWDNFEQLRAGAHSMDEHFHTAQLKYNMPVLLALTGIWHTNFCNIPSHAVIPYSASLTLLPNYLQQLEMESNGKGVTHEGLPVKNSTSPVLWGGVGTNSQHSFHQLLHQGTNGVSIDFIIPLCGATSTNQTIADSQAHLVANCLSQSQVLAFGNSIDKVVKKLVAEGLSDEAAKKIAPHKVIPGNKPHTIITIDQLTPFALGELIALYEHKVYVQSVIWDINAFDQWGVELGKELSTELHSVLCRSSEETKTREASRVDPATQKTIDRFRSLNTA